MTEVYTINEDNTEDELIADQLKTLSKFPKSVRGAIKNALKEAIDGVTNTARTPTPGPEKNVKRPLSVKAVKATPALKVHSSRFFK